MKTQLFYESTKQPITYNGKPFEEFSDVERRYLYYKKGVTKSFVIKSLVKEDSTLTYYNFHYNYKLSKSCNLYSNAIVKKGFTFDYATGKLRLWYGKNIKDILSEFNNIELLKPLGIEWVMNIPNRMITKGLFQRILAGKITNMDDAMDYYLRYSMRIGKTSYRLAAKILRKDPDINFHQFRAMLSCTDNVEKLLQQISDRDSTFMYGWLHHDIVDQCLILGKKVDFTWSEARLKAVHQEFTNEMLAVELNFIGNKNFGYEGNLPLLGGHFLISNERDLFKEGRDMHHCIYSNYKNNIESGSYFAIRIEKENVRATAGISIDHGIAVLNQINGPRNSKSYDITEEGRAIEKWLRLPNVQSWFISTRERLQQRKMDSFSDQELHNLGLGA